MICVENHPDTAKKDAGISFFLFCLGGVVGLLNIFVTTLPFGSGFEMVALATNLAHGGGFANPLLVLPSGPSAVAPPLYPLVLALFIKILPSPLVLLAAAIGDVVANAATAALLPRVSRIFFGESGPGIIAAIFWLMAAQLITAWDANYTVAVLLLFCLVSTVNASKERIVFPGISAGLLAGVLFMLNPMTLLIFLPWLAHLVVFHKASLKHLVAYCCLVLGTVVLVISPWTLRNYHLFGKAVVRTGLGLNIYFSNNDCSRTNLVEDLRSGCASIYMPNYNRTEALAYRDLGEVNYDHQRLETAKIWMRTHPDRFLHLTASRFVAFWFPRGVEHPFRAAVIWIFTLLSIPGLALMAYRRVPVTIFAVLVLTAFPLVYYVIVSDVRYRYPVLWLSLLPAGYFIWQFNAVKTLFEKVRILAG
jgi:hypothetical protein